MAKNKGNQQQGKSTAQSESKRESDQQTAISQPRPNQQTGMWRTGGPLINPFSLMRRFGEDMEQIFDEFGFGRLMPRNFEQMAAWTPQVEILQRDDQLVIRADLPGLNKDNVNVELRDDAVVIRGERQEQHKEEREGFFRTERTYGSFYREIPLPEGIDVDTSKATATFRDGVLEIAMPSSQGQARRRQLEIKDSQTEEQPKQMGRAAGAGR